MTQDELLQAINDAGLTASELTLVLSFAAALAQREKLRGAMDKERAAQSEAVQASEAKLQALQAQFDAANAQIAAQA
jgi:hypothetical protein